MVGSRFRFENTLNGRHRVISSFDHGYWSVLLISVVSDPEDQDERTITTRASRLEGDAVCTSSETPLYLWVWLVGVAGVVAEAGAALPLRFRERTQCSLLKLEWARTVLKHRRPTENIYMGLVGEMTRRQLLSLW